MAHAFWVAAVQVISQQPTSAMLDEAFIQIVVDLGRIRISGHWFGALVRRVRVLPTCAMPNEYVIQTVVDLADQQRHPL